MYLKNIVVDFPLKKSWFDLNHDFFKRLKCPLKRIVVNLRKNSDFDLNHDFFKRFECPLKNHNMI